MDTLTERLQKVTLTPQQVEEASGLSARQIHLWHKSGPVRPDRENPQGWRRFSPYQLFVLKLCADLRKLYGVDLTFFNWLMDELENPRKSAVTMQMLTNWFQAGFSMTALIIPRQQRAWLNPENLHNRRILERRDYGIDLDSFIVHRLDDLLKDTVIFCLGPKALNVNPKAVDFWDNWENKNTVLSATESDVIKLIRTKEYQQVFIQLENGHPVFLKATQTLSDAKLEEVTRLVEEHKYQTIHIANGTKGISISRETNFKAKGGKLR